MHLASDTFMEIQSSKILFQRIKAERESFRASKHKLWELESLHYFSTFQMHNTIKLRMWFALFQSIMLHLKCAQCYFALLPTKWTRFIGTMMHTNIILVLEYRKNEKDIKLYEKVLEHWIVSTVPGNTWAKILSCLRSSSQFKVQMSNLYLRKVLCEPFKIWHMLLFCCWII